MTLGDVGQGEFCPGIFEELSGFGHGSQKTTSLILGWQQLQELQTPHTTSFRVVMIPEVAILYL